MELAVSLDDANGYSVLEQRKSGDEPRRTRANLTEDSSSYSVRCSRRVTLTTRTLGDAMNELASTLEK